MRALLDAERQRADTAERDRDRWHSAFLSLPKPEARTEVTEADGGGLLGWLTGKKSRRA